MVYKGVLNKRDGEIHVYLFDHAILFTKCVKTKTHEQFKVYRRVCFVVLHPEWKSLILISLQPIPLELLYISASDEVTSTVRSGTTRKGQTLTRRASFSKERGISPVVSAVTIKAEPKGQNWINFVHLGKRHYNLVLAASSPVAHRKWLESIWKTQQIMRERSMIFDTYPLSEGFFSGPNKVNCAAPFSEYLSAVLFY